MKTSLAKSTQAVFHTCEAVLRSKPLSTFSFLTVTCRVPPRSPLKALGAKTEILLQRLMQDFDAAMVVFGTGNEPNHAHLLLHRHPGRQFHGKSQESGLRAVIRAARRAAGFSRDFDIRPVHSVEGLSRYMAKNYARTLEWKRWGASTASSRCAITRYRHIPKSLKVKPSMFSRNSPHGKKYRTAMTQLANLCGTPIGDVEQLEQALATKAKDIRAVIFSLFREVATRDGRLPVTRLLPFFPMLRMRLAPSPADTTSTTPATEDIVDDLTAA